jgi:1-acyl-sn-glycerol-3-phosphate acyltransferase
MFKLIFRLAGWKITHYLPDHIKKCVVVVAPHTSNWDFVFGMGAVKYMNLYPRFAIKKEWIRFPFKRMMINSGALPIDRSQKNTLGEKKGTVDAMADLFKEHDTLRLIITPEGTRKRVEKWKTGFYYVAAKAKVPIALGFMDYEKKECGIDKIIYPSGDFKKDMKEIMDFYKNMKGKNNENFTVDTELSKP